MRLVTGMVVALAAGAAGAVWAQAQKAGVVPPGDWQTINRDFAATRYSPLTQINTSNVANLKLAWSFPMQGGGTSVPLAVNGITVHLERQPRDGDRWRERHGGLVVLHVRHHADAVAHRRAGAATGRSSSAGSGCALAQPQGAPAGAPGGGRGGRAGGGPGEAAVRPADVVAGGGGRRYQRAVSGTGPATASWRRAFSS